VLAYDISDNSRRGRIFRLLSNQGLRVNYSVFELWMREEAVERLMDDLERLMDLSTDHIRIYPLCARCSGQVRVLGGPAESEVQEF